MGAGVQSIVGRGVVNLTPVTEHPSHAAEQDQKIKVGT